MQCHTELFQDIIERLELPLLLPQYPFAGHAMASADGCSGTDDLSPTRGYRQTHKKHQLELTPEPSLLDAITQVDHAAKSVFVSNLEGQSAINTRNFRLCCRAARDLLDSVITSPVKVCVAGGGRKRGGEEENRAAWSAVTAAAVDALRVTARRWPRRSELRLHLSGAFRLGIHSTCINSHGEHRYEPC